MLHLDGYTKQLHNISFNKNNNKLFAMYFIFFLIAQTHN